MNYQHIPNTDLKISTFTLGTMTFGGQTSQADSLSIMDYAYEQGINLFDTANIYTGGNSERIVGKWLKARRDQVFLASKCGYVMGSALASVKLDKDSVIKSFDDSLKRLDTDYIDLYYIHAPDYNTPIEEALEVITKLIQEGKVGHLAISNHAAWQIADILAICDKNGYAKPVMTQNVYNAITRSIEAELLPFLNTHDMALTVYNPIAAGLLSGKHLNNTPAKGSRMADNPIYHKRYWSEGNLKSVQKLSKLASDNKMTLLELAFRWINSKPQVTSIIAGVSKLNQLKQNLSTLDGPALSAELLSACDLIMDQHTGKSFHYNR